MPYVRNQTAAAETDTVLIAAPGADRQIVVEMIAWSSDTARTLTLESGTTNLRWEIYAAANTSGAVEAERGLFRCGGNEALTFTRTVTGNSFLGIRYHLARATLT